MSAVTFLSNKQLWQTLTTKVKSARHVAAAIAYIGQGGAKLLPLRRGARLVVDMSRGTVRAGATDPREIEKLMRRGVDVFTRRNIHSKLVVADTFAIAGSTNVSTRSYLVLDEAAILTNDASAIRRARDFIDRLCTEPVRDKYLEQCKRLYRPPRFNGEREDGGKRQTRATHAKLWIVNLTEAAELPESEHIHYERGELEAKKLIKDASRSTAESFHWPYKPRMTNELELGDWIIQIIKYKDGSVLVYPPGRFLYTHNYVRDRKSGKRRYIFHLELPKRGETLSWKKFSRAAKAAFAPAEPARRTRPVRNDDNADALLRLWTPAGHVSRR
jgi:hypothetical protein